MSKITLSKIIARFNQGCSSFERAKKAVENKDMPKYENELRSAATESIGALEWALKFYLRNICRDKISSEDHPKLKQPNFNDLMTLMNKYATPSLDAQIISQLYHYRDLFRNAGEHDASTPPHQELQTAIQKIRWILHTYLSIGEAKLKTVSAAFTPDSVIQDLKNEYFQVLCERYRYIDFGGISPRIGSKIVKISMEDVFIPLQATEEFLLFESFSETVETSERGSLDSEIETDLESLHFEASIRKRHDKEPLQMIDLLGKPRVVILGDPGSGKTTVGKYIAYAIASQKFGLIGEHFKNYVPVIVRAAEYRTALQGEPSLQFYHYVISRHSTKFGKLFNWVLHQNLCVMIIDGLDEVPEAEIRIKISRRIEQFISEFRKNKFLLTSRIAGYRQSRLTGNLVHVKLSELDEEQGLHFLKQWFRAIESETGTQIIDEKSIEHKASDLWKAIEAKPGIRKIAGNPLILTIIALTNWYSKKLPNRRVDLYQIATETLLENWPLYMRGSKLDSEEILAILEPIAYQIFTSGKDNLITEHDFRPIFEQQVCEVRGTTPKEAKSLSRELLRTIETDTGFFLHRGFDEQGQDIYGFWHRTFAEYLTARYLAEEWSGTQLDLRNYVHDPHWYEVLLLMAGHVGAGGRIAQATKLVKNILELSSDYEEFLHRDLFLAADILSDYVRVKRDLQDEIVLKLIKLTLDMPIDTRYTTLSRNTVERLVNVAKVFPLGNTPITEIQIHVEDPAELKVKKAVIQKVVGEDTDEVFRLLFHGLLESKDIPAYPEPYPYEPYVLPYLFHKEEDKPTHLVLVGTEHMVSYHRISEQTANRMQHLNLPFFNLEDLPSKKDLIFQNNRWVFLITREDAQKLSVDEIVFLLTDDKWLVSSIAEATLDLCNSYGTIWDELIHRAVSNNSLDVRLMSLNALSRLRFTPYAFGHNLQSWLETICDLFNSNEDPSIRSKALELVFRGHIHRESEEATKILLQCLNDSVESVRLTATKLCERFDFQATATILKKLRELFMNGTTDIRKSCARAFIWNGKIKEEESISLLKIAFDPAFDDLEIYELRDWLLKLIQLSDKVCDLNILNFIKRKFREIIEKVAVKDDIPDMFYFSSSVWDPRKMRPRKEMVDVLVTLFEHQEPKVRQLAFNICSFISSQSISPKQALSFIKDIDIKVRASAIRTLPSEILSKPEIMDALLHVFIENIPEVAEATVTILSDLKNQKDKQRATERVAQLLTKHPKNIYAHELLWNLVVHDEPPF